MSLKFIGNLRSRRNQAGMTTIGMVILAAFVGLFFFAGIRLTPLYLNYFKVVGVVDGVTKEFDGARATRAEIRKSISRRFDIESVAIITANEVKVKAVDGGFEVVAAYSHKSPFVSNVSFVVDFDKRAMIRR